MYVLTARISSIVSATHCRTCSLSIFLIPPVLVLPVSPFSHSFLTLKLYIFLNVWLKNPSWRTCSIEFGNVHSSMWPIYITYANKYFYKLRTTVLNISNYITISKHIIKYNSLIKCNKINRSFDKVWDQADLEMQEFSLSIFVNIALEFFSSY